MVSICETNPDLIEARPGNGNKLHKALPSITHIIQCCPLATQERNNTNWFQESEIFSITIYNESIAEKGVDRERTWTNYTAMAQQKVFF